MHYPEKTLPKIEIFVSSNIRNSNFPNENLSKSISGALQLLALQFQKTETFYPVGEFDESVFRFRKLVNSFFDLIGHIINVPEWEINFFSQPQTHYVEVTEGNKTIFQFKLHRK